LNIKRSVVLFIPVSSTSGIGEYSRSLIIADELNRQFPEIQIHFLLNKHAKCSQACPFEVHLSEGSATKDTVKVKSVIDSVSPDLVLFDCAGRASHFKYAKKSGAKVIFISQHEKKRARGLGITRLLNSDRQWVAQSLASIKPLSWIQKFKLRLLNQSEPQVIGPIFKLPKTNEMNVLLQQYQLKKNKFLIFNAGSGGHLVAGELASDIFLKVAKEISSSVGIKCVIVFGTNYPKKLPTVLTKSQTEAVEYQSKIVCIQEMDNHLFIGLLLSSVGAVLSGGDTFLQAIELKVNCVVTAVSKDQCKRIESCSHISGIIPKDCNKTSLISGAKELLKSLKSNEQTDIGVKSPNECVALTIALTDIKNLLKIE